MDLAEIARQEAENFLKSGRRVVCVIGGEERERYEFCDLMRERFPNNFIFPTDYGAEEMDAYLIYLSNFQEAA